MIVTLAEVIELVKRLPEKALEEAKRELEKIKEESEQKSEMEIPICPHCEEKDVVRNGKKQGSQRYVCRKCKKSFVNTTKSAMYNSHSSETVWKQIIRDTINGVAIDTTAEQLAMERRTVFNMRHKILYCIEQEQQRNPVHLNGVCEADETYILESYKGTDISSDYWRKARKHGAVATKARLSDEYICICAAVERGGKSMATAVGRSQPSSEDITGVFADKISGDALVLCDGAKSYNILEKNGTCTVMNVSNDDGGFKKINNVNGYHSYIKERNRDARGFATKYLNRYLALFSIAYQKSDYLADDIYKLLCDSKNRYTTIAQTKSQNLLLF